MGASKGTSCNIYNTTNSSRFLHAGVLPLQQALQSVLYYCACCLLSKAQFLMYRCTRLGVLGYMLKQRLARQILQSLLGCCQATDLASQGNMMFSKATMVNVDCLEPGLHGANRQRRLPPGSLRRRLTASA